MDHNGTVQAADRIDEVNGLIAGALEYLRQKYSRTFHALTFKESGFLPGDEELRIYAAGEDPEKQTASVWITQALEGERTMKDNYFAVLIMPAYLSAVREICAALFDGARVFCSGFLESAFDSRLGADTKLDEALASGQRVTGNLFIYISVSGSELGESSQKLEKAMRARGLCGLVSLIALKDSGIEQVDDTNFSDTLRFHTDKQHYISNGISSFYVGESVKTDE